MSNNTVPIGLELYTLRREFEESASKTIEAVAKMGYDGVEFAIDHQHLYKASYLKQLLADNRLRCFGYLVMWEDMQRDTIEKTLDYNDTLGNKMVAVGSAPPELLKTESGLKKTIEHLSWVHEICKKNGFKDGYHNHDIEFSTLYNQKTVWDSIFEVLPEDFPLVLDTGNAMDGGGDPFAVVMKYPKRMPVVHAKPFSHKDAYATMIGDDDIDWPAFLSLCLKTGGTQVFIVEYGNSIKYEPYKSSRLCLDRLRKILGRG